MASLRERPSKRAETTWAVLYRMSGKQRSTTFLSRPDALRFKNLVDLLGPERALAEYGSAEQDGLTVDQLAEKFFEWKARDVTERTLVDYRRDYANWVRPTFGHRQADSVDERDIQGWVDTMTLTLGPKSIGDRHMILHSIYRFGKAKSRGLVDHNPCEETQLPLRRKKPPRGVTLAEWNALYAAARQVEPDAADLMLFIAATGWRWSEAAALMVGYVDERPDRDGVDRVYARMGAVIRDRRVVEEAAKSSAGFRTVSLPHAAGQMVLRRTAGKAPRDLVFTNPTGGQWHQTNFLSRTWSRIVERAELERRPTPHMLRHSHVALLDRAGASLPEMQRRLGHEDIGTTINVYGGMIDDISGATLDKLDALLVGDSVRQIVQGDVVRSLEA